MKGIHIFLADGFEDVEALGTNDVLRRAGLRSTLVGIGEEPFAQSSHGVMVGCQGGSIEPFQSPCKVKGRVPGERLPEIKR